MLLGHPPAGLPSLRPLGGMMANVSLAKTGTELGATSAGDVRTKTALVDSIQKIGPSLRPSYQSVKDGLLGRQSRDGASSTTQKRARAFENSHKTCSWLSWRCKDERGKNERLKKR